MSRQVAVVGAGAAGAATAWALREDADVTVFEREATVGGRSRTREREGCRYETGANYLTATHDDVVALLEDAVPADVLAEPDGAIWPFDGNGTIAEGEGRPREDEGALRERKSESSDGHEVSNGSAGVDASIGPDVGANGSDVTADRARRLTSPDGLSVLTEHVLRATGATVTLDTEVDALERGDGVWGVRDVDGADRGEFDAVVLTAPAPLTADLLGRSEWPHADCRTVRETIECVPYRPIASVVLHYPFELDRPWYALVNDDRAHAIGWVAREGCKPAHVPDGESVLLVQCSSEFTIDAFEDDPADVVDDVCVVIAGLLEDERLADPDWSDFHCWRYGVPEAGVDRTPLACASDHSLYVAGDWVVGEDRLNGALRSGLATGGAVRDDLT